MFNMALNDTIVLCILIAILVYSLRVNKKVEDLRQLIIDWQNREINIMNKKTSVTISATSGLKHRKKGPTLGLRSLRKNRGDKTPQYHCDNCGMDRYSPCKCSIKFKAVS